MESPVVRPAAPADAGAMAVIRIDAWRATYRGRVADEVLDGLDLGTETARFAARIGTDPRYRQIVAAGDDGRVLGYCMLGPDRDAEDDSVGEIYAIYVHPDVQRSGVGGALLTVASRQLAESGCRELHVWALAGNEVATRFYERQGWVRDGLRRDLETLPDPLGRPVPEVRFSAGG